MGTIAEIEAVGDGSLIVTDNLGRKTLYPLSTATIEVHAALDTGVHGAGTDKLATVGQALVWAIVFGS